MVPIEFETFDHTADLGIRVKGASLDQLFANACLALFSVIAECPLPKKPVCALFTVGAEAANTEELLVAWLNELLYVSAVRGVFICASRVTLPDATHVEGEVQGVPASCCRVKSEVKAVTYHQVKVERTKEGWQAEFICDM